MCRCVLSRSVFKNVKVNFEDLFVFFQKSVWIIIDCVIRMIEFIRFLIIIIKLNGNMI